jgi:hypothetical protein
LAVSLVPFNFLAIIAYERNTYEAFLFVDTFFVYSCLCSLYHLLDIGLPGLDFSLGADNGEDAVYEIDPN